MMTRGLLGRKAGKGFYTYAPGKKGKKTINPDAIAMAKTIVKEVRSTCTSTLILLLKHSFTHNAVRFNDVSHYQCDLSVSAKRHL
jgi:3-hydroxyacyl-CoA dehydrogenase